VSQFYACRQGHRWRPAAATVGAAAVRCPVCDGPGQPLPPAEVPEPSPPTRAVSDSEIDFFIPPPPSRELDCEIDLSMPPLLGPTPPSSDSSSARPTVPRRGSGPADSDAPTLPAVPSPFRVPTRDLEARGAAGRLPTIPGYEILQVLGRGGMGVVFKARQRSLNRLVALKMILAGAHASPMQLARFHIEAEALASLQHPNIVQVYEVGEHDGCPYFSLELVDGGSLDERLAGRPQPPRQAAALVETLARAVHVAHLRGIVHRDLKPANILLQMQKAEGGRQKERTETSSFCLLASAFCLPKITDFGLAKRLEEEKSQTQSGAIMGTPDYMAPEQATGRTRDVTPAADVYALGAILYEMLTGRPPFEGTTTLEVLDQVRHQEPLPPSRRQPRVPRDLDTICLKCLSKLPAQRYTSAEALADDLRRFLTDEPIQARPVGRAERIVKWVRRRPTLAALFLVIGFALSCLVAGGITYTVQVRAARDRAERNFQRAEQNFERVRRAVDSLLTEVGQKELATAPHMEQKRQRLLRKALELYEELLQEKSTDPDVRRLTALAYKGHADIQRMLGRHDEARRDYDQAILLLAPLADEAPDRPEFRRALADAHNWRGELLRTTGGPAAEAEADYHRARDLQRLLVEEHPERPEYKQELARTYYNLGLLVQKDTGRLPEAEESFERAIALLKELVERDPREPSYRQELARAYFNRGPVLRLTGRGGLAERDYGKAIALLTALAKEAPEVPDYQHELGVCCNNRGNLRSGLAQYSAAEEDYEQALARFEKLAANFPLLPVYRQELANTRNGRAGLLATVERPAEAEQEWRQALGLFEQLHKDFPEIPDHEARLGQVLGNLGWLQAQRQDLPAAARDAQARRYLEDGTRHVEAALERAPRNPDYLAILFNQYDDLADVLERLNQPMPAAWANYRAALYRLRSLPIAEENRRLAEAERRALREKFTDPALERLQRAARQGFADGQSLRQDPPFAPLRRLPEFGRLLDQVEANARSTPR
jgi:serine/threonine protein kinase/antitoxin component HigA of HigAB toxin-antitoxin module